MSRDHSNVIRWILAATFVLLTLPSMGGCGSKDKKVGESCDKNNDCLEGLICMKPAKGSGTCTQHCSPPENKDPRPGEPPRSSRKSNCPGQTTCLAVKVLVKDSGCSRTYTAQSEFNYCVVPWLERRVNDGARFLVTPR